MLKIKEMIENDKERIRRGTLGKEICKKEYSLETYNNKLKELYNEVYKRKHTNKEIKFKKIDNTEILKMFESIKRWEKVDIKKLDYSSLDINNEIDKQNKNYYNYITKVQYLRSIKRKIYKVLKFLRIKK